jgi:uncharacterized membrane protein YraQ (UPF0718 family)
MKTTTNKKTFALNLLIAIVISVVVNFSYFVFIMVNNRQAEVQSKTEVVVEQQSEQPKVVESTDSTKEEVVVREESISRYSRERSGHSNPWFTREGQVFMWLDMLYYVAVALLLLWIMTTPTRRRKWGYVGRLLVCLALLTLFYFIAPHLTRQGDIIITASARRLFNPMLLLKLSATYIIVVLYGKIFQMHYKQQEIEVENERLKNENLTWQYNTLINQVNPHFLFNSLNSLSMLVREGNKEGALVYIDQMSDTYRYIIQDGTAEMTTVGNELRFLEAYKYLLEIRYAGKLHIEVDVNKALYDYTLPPLSIQPLIENAVKHNTISSSHPMKIDITTEEDYIVVSNTIAPKLEAEESTGIGLRNLSHRYSLLTERDIVVENNGSTFIVKLPIAKPDTK